MFDNEKGLPRISSRQRQNEEIQVHDSKKGAGIIEVVYDML